MHGKAIQTKAKQQVAELYPGMEDEFVASGGWLSRFLRRHRLVSRRVTSTGQAQPANAAVLARQFLESAVAIQERLHSDLSSVGNMDETPFWFDMPSNQTFDLEGVKTVVTY